MLFFGVQFQFQTMLSLFLLKSGVNLFFSSPFTICITFFLLPPPLLLFPPELDLGPTPPPVLMWTWEKMEKCEDKARFHSSGFPVSSLPELNWANVPPYMVLLGFSNVWPSNDITSAAAAVSIGCKRGSVLPSPPPAFAQNWLCRAPVVGLGVVPVAEISQKVESPSRVMRRR